MTSPTPDSTPAEPSGSPVEPSKDRGIPETATPRPPSNAGWAVVSLLFFWPLAFSAFNHAFNVYPLWADGDLDGARYASQRVRRLGQVSLWIAGVLIVLAAILYAIAVIVYIAHGGGGGGYYGRHYMMG